MDPFGRWHLLFPGKRLRLSLKDLLERKMSAVNSLTETNQSNSLVYRQPLFFVDTGYSQASEHVRIHAHGRLLERIRLEGVAPSEVMLTPKDLADLMKKPSST